MYNSNSQGFIRRKGIPVDTVRRVYRRYLKFEPGHAEEYIEFLKECGNWNEVANHLANTVNDDNFQSLAGKSKHQMWLELCDVITKHPSEVTAVDVDSILRSGIRRFSDEVGRLWTSLADYYIRRGLFEKARDVYEEGVSTVITVRDFSLIFDAYTQFEESMLSAKMEAASHPGTAGDEARGDSRANSDGSNFLLNDTGDDLDLRLSRLEFLMSRRPELLSSVMLRQNPHSVHEWQKRIALFDGDPTRQVFAFTEAVKTIEPAKALGKLHLLWVDFAKFYELHGDMQNARVVFSKAVRVPYSKLDDLATVWCEWGELELRQKNYSKALDLMRRATTEPLHTMKSRASAAEFEALPVQERLYKSLKLWTFYCDLEESLGSLESAQAVYSRILTFELLPHRSYSTLPFSCERISFSKTATKCMSEVLPYSDFHTLVKFGEHTSKTLSTGLAQKKWNGPVICLSSALLLHHPKTQSLFSWSTLDWKKSTVFPVEQWIFTSVHVKKCP